MVLHAGVTTPRSYSDGREPKCCGAELREEHRGWLWLLPMIASQPIPDPFLESLGELDEAGLGWRECTRGVV